MLDWLTMKIEHEHDPLPAGVVLSVDQAGEMEWVSPRHMQTTGSYESKVFIRSYGAIKETSRRQTGERQMVIQGKATELHFHGNPSKFMQGHNVWGSDDALALMTAVLNKITSSLGITPVRAQALASATVSRLDFTKSLQFENREQVRAYLSQVGNRAHSRNGRPSTKGSTLYFQKGSRRHTVVCYGKGDELRVNKHKLPDDLPRARDILEEADRLLRVELRLKGKELEKIGMRRLGDCTPERLHEAYADYIGRIEMSTNTKIANDQLVSLGRAVGNTYLMHKEGIDVRSIMTERTFYRHRSQLLRYGIDIAVPMPPDGSAQIIPLHRVIEGQPYSVPTWAHEEGLIFQKTGS